jgi:hypothetical protein
MANGRFVSASVATDKRLNDLSLEAELLYLKTIPHLDRDGLILGEPLALWGQVARRRPELMTRMAALVDEWVESGLVVRYEADGDPILWFVGFTKNQQGMRYAREAESRLPPPPGYARLSTGLVREHGGEGAAGMVEPLSMNAGVSPELVRSDAGVGTAEVKGEVKGEVEVKGEGEVKGQGALRRAEPLPADPPSLPPAVLAFAEFLPRGSPSAAQATAIVTGVSDVERWRAVLTEWSLRGYNVGNVAGLLDWYRDGIPPGGKPAGGKPAGGKSQGGAHGKHGGSFAQNGVAGDTGADGRPDLDPELVRQLREKRERRGGGDGGLQVPAVQGHGVAARG